MAGKQASSEFQRKEDEDTSQSLEKGERVKSSGINLAETLERKAKRKEKKKERIHRPFKFSRSPLYYYYIVVAIVVGRRLFLIPSYAGDSFFNCHLSFPASRSRNDEKLMRHGFILWECLRKQVLKVISWQWCYLV